MSEQDLLVMFLLPHVRVMHLSIIHVLGDFSKLENRRKSIKEERRIKAEKRVRDLLYARKQLAKNLK